jgi:hypothetical protein
MTSAAGGLWHPEPKKWLKKCDKWFDLIKEWPSRILSKKLVSLTDPFMWICPMIWRWDVSVRSLFWGILQWTRWNVTWWSLEICLRKVSWTWHKKDRHWCSPMTQRRRCSHQSGTQIRLPNQENHALSDPKKKWCSFHSLTSMVWCTVSSYCLDRVLLVTSMRKYCRGCMMKFTGSGTTSGRDSVVSASW